MHAKKSAQLHAETLKCEEEKKFKSPRLKILMKFDIPLKLNFDL